MVDHSGLLRHSLDLEKAVWTIAFPATFPAGPDGYLRDLCATVGVRLVSEDLLARELIAWRNEDRITGTATDDATLRLRDIADRLIGPRGAES